MPATSSPGGLGTGHAAHPLLLAYDFPPRGGGIARALWEIARHGGLVVSTGSAEGAAELDRSGQVRVERAPVALERLRTVPGLLRWGRSASRLAAGLQPEFVWAGNLKPAGYVARWLRARHGIPYGLIVYGLDLGLLQMQAARTRRRYLAARALLQGAAGVVAISRWAAERYFALARQLHLPVVPARVRVIRLGADPGRFRPDGAALDLGPGRWLLTVARLVPHKGVDTALAALAQLGPGARDVRYAIAGEGPDRPRLERLAAELGVAERVRFLGAVSEADLPALYRAATIYLGLSREEGPQGEGFGLALAEAAASGRPVVAARSGGVADAVLEGASAILVPPADPAAAARAIETLLAQPDRAAEFGRAGRRLVETELNWDRVVSELRLAQRGWG
jgi:phosphatidylinositol alpha-1,6-mannosyltransferase